eukprot:GSMAST32.ASY1.ANO1.1870.1 assembled CDS
MFHMQQTFLVGSAAHKAFFEASDEELDQAPVYRFMVPVFGKGVVYDAPLTVRRQQFRMLGNSLRPSGLRRYPEVIAAEARDFFSTSYGPSADVDLLHSMADLTILTASATLHGPDVRQKLHKQVSHLFRQMDEGISPLSIVMPYLPTPAHRRRDAAHRKMVKLFAGVIRDRRKAERLAAKTTSNKTSPPTDILHKLIHAKYKDGTRVPGHEIAGMLIAALFAGQHTSSVTVTWTILFLLDNHRKHEKENIEGKNNLFCNGKVTHDDVSKMKILHACVKESIRMFPPLIFLMRRVVKKPLDVEGFKVPVGHNVMYVLCFFNFELPEVFENPNTWLPGRWLDFDIRTLPPYSFIGFGAGIHTCMGESFAFMQIKTILAVLLTTYDMKLTGPLPPASYDAMVVMPRGPNITSLKTVTTKSQGKKKSNILKTLPSSNFEKNENSDPNEEFGLDSFTIEEISKHSKRDDLWIIVKDRVYDVTQFLPVHQGGDSLLKWGGKDATVGVFGPQHPSTVPTLLKRYLIGKVDRN